MTAVVVRAITRAVVRQAGRHNATVGHCYVEWVNSSITESSSIYTCCARSIASTSRPSRLWMRQEDEMRQLEEHRRREIEEEKEGMGQEEQAKRCAPVLTIPATAAGDEDDSKEARDNTSPTDSDQGQSRQHDKTHSLSCSTINSCRYDSTYSTVVQ